MSADHDAFTYPHALALGESIKSMAFDPAYDPASYRARVVAYRDCMIQLAHELQFGQLAKVSQQSVNLLAPIQEDKVDEFYHILRREDLAFHLTNLPAIPAGLIHDISTDKALNALIVESAMRSETLDEGMWIVSINAIAKGLAKVKDIESWLKLIHGVGSPKSQFDLVAKTLGLFDLEYLAAQESSHPKIMQFLDWSPYEVVWHALREKISSTRLYDALHLIGAKDTILKILKVCWAEFHDEYALQKNMERYGVVPDHAYRLILASAVHATEYAQYRHLPTSYYMYELVHDRELCPIKAPMSAEILLEVIEMDGKDTPYGKVIFHKEMLGKLLDENFKAALKKRAQDWSLVEKEYASIPREHLLKSNIYKGRMLGADLGL